MKANGVPVEEYSQAIIAKLKGYSGL